MANAILLAENSDDDAFFFMRVLDSVGVANPVHVVTDGCEAIAYLKGEDQYTDREHYPEPCILFLDLRMPRADGWYVLKWLSSQTPRKTLLVFVLSGEDRVSHLQEAYAMGANSYFIKPIQAKELRGLINYWPGPWVLGSPPEKSPDAPLAV